MELQPKKPCGSLQVSRYYFRIAWICWVDECSHDGCCRDNLVQEFQALRPHFQIQRGHARDIATRAAKAGNKPSRDRIGCYPEDDWNRRTRCLCREGRGSARRGNHVHTAANQIGCQRRQLIVVVLRPAELDRHVLAFDEGGPVQPAAEFGHEMRGPLGRLTVKEANHQHRRLLRPRCDRPRCRAAEQRDKLAALHYSITSSARVSSGGGTVSPIAFAVLRLMTSSNVVGCSIGRLAGSAPLKILSTSEAARRIISEYCGP